MGNFPVTLITGKSERMKTIVRKIVKEHGFTEDNFWNDNQGDKIKELNGNITDFRMDIFGNNFR